MSDEDLDFTVSHLGEPRIPSPMRNASFVVDDQRVLFHSDLGLIETAGPREKIYFDPSKLKCGIVTCGGLCPGLNDVIRAIVLALIHHYGVKTIFGFRFGFEGLTYRHGHVPLELTPTVVEEIHKFGGSILGSSRGPQDIPRPSRE